jgi:thermolysin
VRVRRLVALAALLFMPAVPSADEVAADADILSRLAEDSTRPLVARTDPGESVPSFVTGRIPVRRFSSSGRVAERGWDFWDAYGRAFGIEDPRAQLDLGTIERDDLGITHLRYDQRHRGLPVFGRQLVLHLDGDAVTVVNGEFTPNIGLSITPAVSSAEARAAARVSVPARGLRTGGPPPELLVHVGGAERPRLAWRVTVASRRPLGLWVAFVDTLTGETLTSYSDLHTARNRRIHTNGNDPDCNTLDAPQCVLPGSLVRSEGGGATGDPVVNDNYAHAGTTYDYYSSTFGRDSYDGAGHHIRSTVHFGSGYDNAFWCDDVCAALFGSASDGEQVVFGDGSGTVFGPLSRDVDIVAHELTHGVTASEANLTYQGQSGALNESYSDVFAAMVDAGDWLIGEDSWTPGTPGDALRNMADPSAGGQPEHMSEYVETVYDSGGVHINSGIPNHAAYLTSEGPGYGIGRLATQQIYYRALTTYLTAGSDFLDNLNALLQSAAELFPGDATKTAAVARANAAVGIANPPTVTFPNGGESLAAATDATVTWTTDANGRPFRVSSLRDLGSTTYTQGFEGSPGLPAEFSTGGDNGWFVTTMDPAPGGGLRNVRSGVIGHDQRSELSMTVRLAAPGTASFRYRASTEAGFDFLSFFVDGEQLFAASGQTPWITNAESIGAGTHALTWVYEKDDSVVGGSDLARIDDIAVSDTENVVLTAINASTAPGATTQSWTTPAEHGANVKVRVETLGVAPWYSTDDSDAVFTIGPSTPPPLLSIGNARKTEPDSGKRTMRFRVFLSHAAGSPVTVNFATRSGTARASEDFRPARGRLTFRPGVTARVVRVSVRGDLQDERNEKLFVTLSRPGGATIKDRRATGKILDDD